MGCGGSKTATANTAPAAAPAAAQAESQSQIPEGDFKINLENASGSESLGAKCTFPETKYILVESVKEEGLIPSWNKGCENTPEMQVQAGDLIVVVNGVFGRYDLMLTELKSKQITLTVKRGKPATGAPVAEEPAVEAPAKDAPAAEAPAVEAPSAEAPVAEVAVTEAAAVEGPAAESPAAEATPADVPVVNAELEGSVSIEPEGAELGTSAKEERLCKLAIC